MVFTIFNFVLMKVKKTGKYVDEWQLGWRGVSRRKNYDMRILDRIPFRSTNPVTPLGSVNLLYLTSEKDQAPPNNFVSQKRV